MTPSIFEAFRRAARDLHFIATLKAYAALYALCGVFVAAHFIREALAR